MRARRVVFVVTCLIWGSAAGAQDEQSPDHEGFPTARLGAADRVPPLVGEDQRKAAAFQKAIVELCPQARYAELLPQAEEMVAIRRRVQGEAWWETRYAEHLLETLRHMAAQPLEVRLELAEADRIEVSEIHQLYRAGRFRQAAEAGQRELDIRLRHLGERRAATLTAMANLGSIHRQLGEYHEAEVLLRRAVPLHRAVLGERHPGTLWCLNNLAQLLRDQGKYSEAEPLYRELHTWRSILGHEHPSISIPMHNLALVLMDQSKYAEADRMFRTTLAQQERIHGREHSETAQTLYNHGGLLMILGRYTESEAALTEAIDLMRSKLGRQHRHTLSALYRLALLRIRQRAHPDAETLLHEVIDLQARTLGREHPDTLRSRAALARVFLLQGRRDPAETLLKTVLATLARTVDPQHPLVLTTLNHLARTLIHNPARFDEAERILTKSVARARPLSTAHPFAFIEAHVLQGDFLLYARNKPRRALRAYRDAAEHVERMRLRGAGDELDHARLFSQLTAADPFSGLARAHLALARAESDADAMQHHLSQAQTALERSRGRALLDLLDRGDIDMVAKAIQMAQERNQPQLVSAIKRIRDHSVEARAARLAAERKLEILELDPDLGNPQLEQQRRDLTAERERALDQERQAVREMYSTTREVLGNGRLQPLPTARIAEGLNPAEVLLMYDVSATDAVVLAVYPDASVRGQRLQWPDGRPVNQTSLNAAVEQFVRNLSRRGHPADAPNSTAYSERDLYRAIIPQDWKHIHSATRLLIVPDGALHRLPFEALPTDAAGRPFMELGPAVVYGPSATVLTRLRRGRDAAAPTPTRTTPRPLLVAVGDPRFDGRPGFAGMFPPLPGTRTEVLAIADLFQKHARGDTTNLRLLFGKQATAARLFTEATAPRYLHLATHGVIHGGPRVQESALALAMPADAADADPGLLRLADLLDHWGGRLAGTRMVVLSACRSAQGRLERGEGFVALTWGFLYGGADSVVVSHWNVDDVSTAILMTEFYRHLLGDGSNRAEALRQARIRLRGMTRAEVERRVEALNDVSRGQPAGRIGPATIQRPTDRPFEDPYYWAPFVLIGHD